MKTIIHQLCVTSYLYDELIIPSTPSKADALGL